MPSSTVRECERRTSLAPHEVQRGITGPDVPAGGQEDPTGAVLCMAE